MDAQLLADYGRSCAHALARAHARTVIACYRATRSGDVADIAFTRFAEAYARQNERTTRPCARPSPVVASPQTDLEDSWSAPSSFVSSSSNHALTYRILLSALSCAVHARRSSATMGMVGLAYGWWR